MEIQDQRKKIMKCQNEENGQTRMNERYEKQYSAESLPNKMSYYEKRIANKRRNYIERNTSRKKRKLICLIGHTP